MPDCDKRSIDTRTEISISCEESLYIMYNTTRTILHLNKRILIIMCIYHELINTLSAHMKYINLNTSLYTHRNGQHFNPLFEIVLVVEGKTWAGIAR